MTEADTDGRAYTAMRDKEETYLETNIKEKTWDF